MKLKKILLSCFFVILYTFRVYSQCSLCTKTAQQLGEKPAEGLNSAIIYLMATPFLIVGGIYLLWRKNQINKKK